MFVVLDTNSLTAIANWQTQTESILPTGKGIDIMAAFSLAWVLGIADFTRYTPTVKSATIAPMIGACIALIWFTFVGFISTIGTALSTGIYNPDNSAQSSLVTSLGLGWLERVLIV